MWNWVKVAVVAVALVLVGVARPVQAQLSSPTLTGAATNAQPLMDSTVQVGNFGIGAVIVLAIIGVVLAVAGMVKSRLGGGRKTL